MQLRSTPLSAILACIALLLGSGPSAEARTRSKREAGPYAWLHQNARAIATTEPVGAAADLDPLSDWVREAKIVAIGDLTHGTREIYTLKQRILAQLAAKNGVRTVVFEGPWTDFLKINRYLQEGDGDVRAIIGAMPGYFFWNYAEFLDLVEWARDRNRISTPQQRIHFLGIDIYSEKEAAQEVLRFLLPRDPSAHASALGAYACTSGDCRSLAAAVVSQLEQSAASYIARSSRLEYLAALQSARVVVQTFDGRSQTTHHRDLAMADNVTFVQREWLNDGKLFLWSHNEHVATATRHYGVPAPFPMMGKVLQERYGPQLFVIGTMCGRGSYTAFDSRSGAKTQLLGAPGRGSYEEVFSAIAIPRMMFNMRSAELPSWLAGPSEYRYSLGGGLDVKLTVSLPARFDAVIYLDTTTAATTLPR